MRSRRRYLFAVVAAFALSVEGQAPARVGSAQMPAWSPDGAKLAVQSGAKGIPAHVWTVDASSGSAQKLGAHTEPYVDEVPAWFPDGKHIAFQSDRSGAMEIWVMGSDGSAPRQVTR